MEVMKQLRQRAIRDLVEQRPIRTQQELAAALRERGFRTTQATISRDVAELGLIKVTREGTAAYALPPRLIEAETSGEDRLRKLLSDLPLEIHEAGLLLVLRTLPGSAHAIAAALDRARWPEVAGSIAGDDTLFVALPGPRLAAARQAPAAAADRGRRAAARCRRPPLTPTPPARLPFAPGRNFRRAARPRVAWSSFLYHLTAQPGLPTSDPPARGGQRP